MSGKITILGSGTCQIQKERMASSVLIELDDVRIVFDFGRGICQRLLDAGLKQDQVRNIVLSHFHPDHISDLIPYLHAAAWSGIDPRSKDLNIYGPPGAEDCLINLIGSKNLVRENYKINVHEISRPQVQIQGKEFAFCKLPHPDNLGMKFRHGGKNYALTGDSDFDRDEIGFVAGAELAVIDAGHITPGEIVDLAVFSQVKTLVCSHLYRELDENELNRAAARKGFQGEIVTAYDLREFPV